MSIFVFFLHQFLKDFTSDDALRLLLSIEAFEVLFLIPCHIALFSPIPRQSGAQARVLLMPAEKKAYKRQSQWTLEVLKKSILLSYLIFNSSSPVANINIINAFYQHRHCQQFSEVVFVFRFWRYVQDCCQ